jgi:hypothetical protein
MENINIIKDDIHCKYPRTYHLPYSLGTTNDDKKLKDDSNFIGQDIIVTEKIDGENCSMTNDRIWARSVDSKDHPSRNWINNLWNQLRYDIPDGLRLCGENVYAKHSIFYSDLPTYFLLFSVWEGKTCLSWNDTIEIATMLGLITVPVLYEGKYDRGIIESLMVEPSLYGGDREGVVVRKPISFHYDDFSNNLTKNVRKGHVQTSKHWMKEKVVPNGIDYSKINN